MCYPALATGSEQEKVLTASLGKSSTLFTEVMPAGCYFTFPHQRYLLNEIKTPG